MQLKLLELPSFIPGRLPQRAGMLVVSFRQIFLKPDRVFHNTEFVVKEGDFIFLLNCVRGVNYDVINTKVWGSGMSVVG